MTLGFRGLGVQWSGSGVKRFKGSLGPVREGCMNTLRVTFGFSGQGITVLGFAALGLRV